VNVLQFAQQHANCALVSSHKILNIVILLCLCAVIDMQVGNAGVRADRIMFVRKPLTTGRVKVNVGCGILAVCKSFRFESFGDLWTFCVVRDKLTKA
jgi:hypothetical protein